MNSRFLELPFAFHLTGLSLQEATNAAHLLQGCLTSESAFELEHFYKQHPKLKPILEVLGFDFTPPVYFGIEDYDRLQHMIDQMIRQLWPHRGLTPNVLAPRSYEEASTEEEEIVAYITLVWSSTETSSFLMDRYEWLIRNAGQT